MDQVARTVLGLLLLATVACVVPLVDGVRQARVVVGSTARGAVQLLAVGLLLGAVFRAPVAVLPLLAVMVAAATATVAPRLAGLPAQGRWPRSCCSGCWPRSPAAPRSPGRWCSPPGR
jgi:ABC-type iron transport system FetAB permease component